MSSKTHATIPGGGVRFATGTYTGDGNATQPIIGVGFQPRFVIVYNQSTQPEEYALKTDQDGLFTKTYSGALDQFRYYTDFIISLDADGFTVGDCTTGLDNVLNTLGRDYTYLCFA